MSKQHLLTTLLVAIAPLGLAIWTVDAILHYNTYLWMVPLAALGLAVIYWINAQGHFHLASVLTILLCSGAVLGTVFTDTQDPETNLKAAILPVFLTSLLLDWRWVLGVMMLEIVGMLGAANAINFSYDDLIFGYVDFLVVGTAFALVFVYYVDRAQLGQRQELMESENRYRIVSELTSDYAYAITLNPGNTSSKMWATEAFYRITGYTLDDLNPIEGWSILPHPDDAHIIKARQSRLFAGEPDVSEYRILTKQGDVRWLRDYGRPVWSDDGSRVVIVYGAAQDITRQKELESQRAEDEVRYRSLFEQSNDGVFIMDLQGKHIMVNQRAADMLGYSVEALTQLTWREVIDLREQFDSASVLDQLLAGAKLPIYERLFVRKDGTTLPVEINVSLIRYPDGAPRHIQSIVRDISARKEILETLRLQKRAIEASTSTILIADATQPDMPIIYANPSFAEVTGYSIEYVLGRNARFLQGSDRNQPEIDIMREALTEGKDCTVVVRNYRSDGSLFWNELFLSPIHAENGDVTHFIGVQTDVTERKQREEALRASEMRYRGLVESQHDLILRTDPGGNFTFVNDAFCRAVNRAREHIIGTHSAQYLPPIEIPQDQNRVTISQRLLTSGGWRWYIWEHVAIYDEYGHVQEFQAVGRDIQDLRLAQEQLVQRMEELSLLHRLDEALGYTLEEEQLLDLAMQILREYTETPAIIALIDRDRQVLKPVRREGHTDFLPEPIPLMRLDDEAPQLAEVLRKDRPESQPLTQQLIIPLILRGEAVGLLILDQVNPWRFDLPMRRLLGQIANRMIVALDNAQSYQRVLYNAQQMDILYQLGQFVTRSLNRTEVIEITCTGLINLLEGESTFYYDYDADASTVTEVFHYASDGGIGTQSLRDYLCEYANKIRQTQHISIDATNPSPAALQLLAALHTPSLLIIPVGDSEAPTGFMVICKASEALPFIQDDLKLASNLAAQASIVLSRTSILTHLQESEQIKSEMIRMASHDLRNPLAQIKGYLDLLLDNLTVPLTEVQQEFVRFIERGHEKMDRIIEEILNVDRVESHIAGKWEHFDGFVALCNVVDGIDSQTRLKNQTATVALPPAEPPLIIFGSEIQIQQALSNLVDNAIKYTPDGGKIEIRATLENDRLRFEVEDNGYGIPKDRQEQLFERFYRAKTRGTEHIGGTGLGLSLVKTVVERHKGTVYFESEEGVGSVFGCYLPLVKNPQYLEPSSEKLPS